MNLRALIAANLRRIRLAKRCTQEQLAHESDVAPSYLWGLEQGDVNPTIDVLERLANALDVHVRDLLAELEPGAEEPAALPKGMPAHRKPRRSPGRSSR